MKTFIGSIACAVFLGACSADIEVFNADGSDAPGIPFRAAELYKKSGMRIAHSKGGDCTPVPFVEVVSLSTGREYFINVRTAELAESEFVTKLSATGTLLEVSLNSKPAAAEQIGAVNELLQTILSAAAPAAAVAVPVPPGAPKACDAGEQGVVFEKFSVSQ